MVQTLHERFNSSIGYSAQQWLPVSEIQWSLTDLGPMHGAILVERLRTFGTVPFQLDRHATRFAEGALALGIDLAADPEYKKRFSTVVNELIHRNLKLVHESGEVGIVILLSPGDEGWGHSLDAQPSWKAHLIPIPWKRLADWYAHGCSLVTTHHRNVPPSCWSPSIKARSRLHYYMADREVHQRHPGSVALLLNMEGEISETSVANVLIVDKQGHLWSPPRSGILNGVSLDFLEELAAQEGFRLGYRTLLPQDLLQAHEVFLVGTTGCIWPVDRIDGTMIASGGWGEMTRRLAQAWKNHIGLDFMAQATQLGSTAL